MRTTNREVWMNLHRLAALLQVGVVDCGKGKAWDEVRADYPEVPIARIVDIDRDLGKRGYDRAALQVDFVSSYGGWRLSYVRPGTTAHFDLWAYSDRCSATELCARLRATEAGFKAGRYLASNPRSTPEERLRAW